MLPILQLHPQLRFVHFFFTFILGILCHEFLPYVSKFFILASFFRVIGEPRTAVLHKGKKGFGFVLRGAKAASPLMDMVPSDKCPGLQYMDDVDPGGVADMAGIRKGDFLLEVRKIPTAQFGSETYIRPPIHSVDI